MAQSEQFVPSEIFIYGPGVASLTRSAEPLHLVMGPGRQSVIILKGPVPFRKSVRYPERDDTEVKITPLRTFRHVTFELCGTKITEIVNAVSAANDMDGIGRAIQPLMEYVRGRFLIE